MTTFEIKNLHSNNLHELGKQAISFWIGKHPETLYPRFYEKFITDGIDLILYNSFQFDNINYIRTLGAAMGTKMALMYSNHNLLKGKST